MMKPTFLLLLALPSQWFGVVNSYYFDSSDENNNQYNTTASTASGDHEQMMASVLQNSTIQQQQLLRNSRDLFFLDKSSICPPEGFDARKDFDVDLYFGKWYAHKQIPVAYQTLDEFYCVTATYTRDRSFCLFCNYAPRIDILNEARKGGVTGEYQGGTVPFFRGIIRQPNRHPARITVGTFAPFLIRARYWVVAMGSYNDLLELGTATGTGDDGNYEWAIITGGPPVREGQNGKCKPYPGILNFLGMWMFLRDSVPPAGVIDAIDTYASDVLGLDTTAWLPVEHVGCTYESP